MKVHYESKIEKVAHCFWYPAMFYQYLSSFLKVQGVDITTVYKEQDKEQTEEQKKRAAHFREVIFQKKLEEATKQMQELGFNNEGGWMTQLLISKDCDITRVLDALHLRAQQK